MRCLNCGYTGISVNAVHCTNCGVHLPSLMRDCLEPGTLLYHDTYRIDYPLGRGGFGITYRAYDIPLDRPVAIKEFYPQEHAIREGLTGRLVVPHTKQDVYHRGLQRFLREGTVLAKLKHAGVVDVYTAFQERETAYLVMELVAGRTLRDELNEQPSRRLEVDRVRSLMTQLVNALAVVHQRGVYHLDIAPDNVLVTPEGQVVLIDFGASRQGLGSGTTQAFKEAYAPPEVINGMQTDARSDVFELGMMLHELLLGELPPNSISRLFSFANHKTELWDQMKVPEPWRGLIASAIQLNPEHRPSEVQSWWKAINCSNQTTEDVESGSNTRNFSNQKTEVVPASPRPEPIAQPPISPSPISQPPISTPSSPPIRDFIPSTPPSPPPPVAPLHKPAGFWMRFTADLIDRTILIIASVIAIQIFQLNPSLDNYFYALFFMYIPLGFVYTAVLESSKRQATFGKQLIGIEVTDRNWRSLSLQRAFVRDACKFFSYLTFGIGFFMVGFTETRQALHDRMTNCFVIRKV